MTLMPAPKHPRRRPLPATDLQVKVAKLGTVDHDDWVIVTWWQSYNDPALESLGGGVVTVSVARRPVIENEMLRLPDPTAYMVNTARGDDQAMEKVAYPEKFIHTIPIDDLIDLRIIPSTEKLTNEMLHQAMSDTVARSQ